MAEVFESATVFTTPDFEETRLRPVDAFQVETRLSPLAWPTTLDSNSNAIALDMSGAWSEAREVYQGFTNHYQAAARDEKLSPTGVAAENAAWARRELPKLEKRLTQIMERSDEVITRFTKKLQDEYMGKYAGEPTEPHEIALAQEIRGFIRGLPEIERTSQVMTLINKGDKAAIRAVLSAPSYLTGVDQSFIEQVRDDMIRRTNPEQHAKLEAVRAGREATIRAMDYVIRHIGSETRTLAELRGPKQAA